MLSYSPIYLHTLTYFAKKIKYLFITCLASVLFLSQKHYLHFTPVNWRATLVHLVGATTGEVWGVSVSPRKGKTFPACKRQICEAAAIIAWCRCLRWETFSLSMTAVEFFSISSVLWLSFLCYTQQCSSAVWWKVTQTSGLWLRLM